MKIIERLTAAEIQLRSRPAITAAAWEGKRAKGA
jgi:hypothetical protein